MSEAIAAPDAGGDGPEAGPWTDDEPLECTLVIPEAPNVCTFSFRAPSGAWFDYRAGQFVTLELPTPGGAIQRTYTISSTPSRPLSLSVTVKAQPDSVGSRWMIDHLKPGHRIRAHGPAGIFTLPKRPRDKYLFIAAGSGVTPMMSMATYLYDYGDQPDVRLISCAQRPSELIFRDRLEHMASRLPGIRLSFVVEEEEPYRVWTGFQGRLNQLILGAIAPDYLERKVYCCGPEPFMQAVRDSLIGLGFEMENYLQENFQAPIETKAEAPPLEDVVPQEAAKAAVVFAKTGRHREGSEADTVLALARASGVAIPSGCTFGVCGTCKVKKLSGDVHMVHNGGISEEDVEDGYILACCSHPIGKVEIDA
ncbi:MAG: hybrid-cluster NAD(P)-dependent oxidoreductase [Pseudomonadota bacterium]